MSAPDPKMVALLAEHELMSGHTATKPKGRFVSAFVCRCGHVGGEVEGASYSDLHAAHVAQVLADAGIGDAADPDARVAAAEAEVERLKERQHQWSRATFGPRWDLPLRGDADARVAEADPVRRAQTAEKRLAAAEARAHALVRALERRHGKKKPPPTIPIGTRVRVHDGDLDAVGTVVGRDGYGFDGVSVIFDEPAPRGYEDGCCAGVEQVEVLASNDATALARVRAEALREAADDVFETGVWGEVACWLRDRADLLEAEAGDPS